MTGGPLSDAKFDERELAWIGAGMAAGHLQQAATGRMAVDRRRNGRTGSYRPAPPLLIQRLEHMYAACEWLMFSARYKVLSACG